MIFARVDPLSPTERLADYYAARARVEGFHPSDTAARATRGLAILRRIAWIDQSKRNHVAGARPAVCCLHVAGSRHLPTSRAPGAGQGALIHVGREYARAETLDGRHPTTDICETKL